MKRKLTGILMMLAAVILIIGACAPSANSVQTSVSVTVEPTPSMTPAPSVPQPVTDIPSDFLPGLSDAGVVPENPHQIGIIVKGTESGSELETICKAYQERFGVTITASVAGDAAQQRAAAEELLSSGVELLIVEPADDAPSEVDKLCGQQGVPYISMGGRLDSEPGQNGYICAIVRDDYLTGVLTGISIVQSMNKKYGQPRGNIAELTGVVSNDTSVKRSQGLRRVFAANDKLRVVCSVAGGDDKAAYAAAVNILKAYRVGELDGIVAADDAAALQVLQAVLNYDRTELLGAIWTAGGTTDGLTGVWYGQFAQTVESTAFSGLTALEYALQYLEGRGDDIPPVVTAVTRAFSADTEEKKTGIASLIAELKELGVTRCVESAGEYEPFLPDAALLQQYYPTPWFKQGENYLNELEPYTTQEAIYASQATQQPVQETGDPEAEAAP